MGFKKQPYHLLTNTSVAVTNNIGHVLLDSYPYRQLFFTQSKEINGKSWSKRNAERKQYRLLLPRLMG
jgi:hypothetical protein